VNDGVINALNFNNNGSVEISSTGTVNGVSLASKYTQTAGNTVVNGSFSIGTVDIQAGTLTGNGTIQATQVASNAINIGAATVVNPGNSTGSLTLVGDVNWSGMLQIDIANMASYDLLKSLGTINFNPGSNVEFKFDSGFTVQDGQKLTFLDSTNLLGANNLQYLALGLGTGITFDVTQDLALGDLSLSFHVAAVPLPGAVWLFGSGLFSFICLKRRSKIA